MEFDALVFKRAHCCGLGLTSSIAGAMHSDDSAIFWNVHKRRGAPAA